MPAAHRTDASIRRPLRCEQQLAIGPPAIQSSSSIVCTTGNAAAGKLGDAADIAGGDQVGLGGAQVAQLALAQPRGDLRLQHVVGAGRTAADMRLPRFDHGEAGLRSSAFGSAVTCWPCCRLQAE